MFSYVFQFKSIFFIDFKNKGCSQSTSSTTTTTTNTSSSTTIKEKEKEKEQSPYIIFLLLQSFVNETRSEASDCNRTDEQRSRQHRSIFDKHVIAKCKTVDHVYVHVGKRDAATIVAQHVDVIILDDGHNDVGRRNAIGALRCDEAISVLDRAVDVGYLAVFGRIGRRIVNDVVDLVLVHKVFRDDPRRILDHLVAPLAVAHRLVAHALLQNDGAFVLQRRFVAIDSNNNNT